MEKLVLEYIKENSLIKENDKILVAVSGGPDSMCLLNILNNLKDVLKIELYAAHVNHLIRTDAQADAEYVQEYCDKKSIKFFLKECDVKEVSKKEKIGVEEAGRNIRYSFFEEICYVHNINKIAIGHNKNDLAETMIMNILRGTGMKGLTGISAKSSSKSYIYIRPLLHTAREKIEEYCSEFNLNPRIDSTNFENEYTRNKIRNIVIPYIKKEFNPNIIDTLVRLSQIIVEEQEYIDLEVHKYYEKIMILENTHDISISGKEFSLLNIAIKKRILFYITNKLFGTTKQIEKIHIEDIIKLIDNNKGNKYLMPNKNFKISIKKGIVLFEKL